MYHSLLWDGISSYAIRDGKVFYSNQYVPDAQWSEFNDLGQGYGKDNHHVFYMGQIVSNAHPYSFQLIDNTYARDHQHVFQYGQIIESLQSPISSVYSIPTDSASTATPSYEIRDFKVFFDNKHLPDARWIDFTILGHGYGKDIYHVFFMGDIVEDANSFSFEVLNKGYAKDRYHVFHNGKMIPDLHPTGFRAPSNQ